MRETATREALPAHLSRNLRFGQNLRTEIALRQAFRTSTCRVYDELRTDLELLLDTSVDGAEAALAWAQNVGLIRVDHENLLAFETRGRIG